MGRIIQFTVILVAVVFVPLVSSGKIMITRLRPVYVPRPYVPVVYRPPVAIGVGVGTTYTYHGTASSTSSYSRGSTAYIIIGVVGGIVGLLFLVWAVAACCRSHSSTSVIYDDAPVVTGNIQYGSAVIPTLSGDVITYNPYYNGPNTVEIVDIPDYRYY